MTLLDAQPPKPVTGIRRFVPLPLLILIVALTIAMASYALWDYPEERAVTNFLTAVENGQYQKAYQLWQPSKSYSFDDFMHDWGEHGDYGKIHSFEILDSKSKGSSTVVVTVSINGVNPPLDLLVDRKTKGLAYSFF